MGEARAAGFDCRAARSHVEKLICADPELSRLDDRLKALFLKVQGETWGHDAESDKLIDPMGEEQGRWRETIRDACPNVACLRKAYAARIRQVRERWSDALR